MQYGIRGLHFKTAENKDGFAMDWCNKSDKGTWVYCDVPYGNKIVGMRCNAYDEGIDKISFEMASTEKLQHGIKTWDP